MPATDEPKIMFGSESQKDLLARIKKVAATDAEMLICGPSGVGKELYASYAHAHSGRCDRAFVVLNCSNLSSELLESEIFGHVRGAFTGAVNSVSGIAGAAEGGTLFLDEVDALPLPCQAKILRFVQSKEYRRLGESHVRRADVRLIAASNADLPALVKSGRFREDLYFRLRVVPIEVEPLSERRADIVVLLEHFVAKYAKEYNVAPLRLSSKIKRVLECYSWPGNVRELENVVRYLTCLQLERPITVEDLRLHEDPGDSLAALEISEMPLKKAKSKLVGEFERLYIDHALTESHGNVTKAAEKSGKHRRAFTALLHKYGVCAKDYRV